MTSSGTGADGGGTRAETAAIMSAAVAGIVAVVPAATGRAIGGVVAEAEVSVEVAEAEIRVDDRTILFNRISDDSRGSRQLVFTRESHADRVRMQRAI